MIESSGLDSRSSFSGENGDDSDVLSHRPTSPSYSKGWLMPDSAFRLTWDIFIFLVIWYNSVVTPIRIFLLPVNSTPDGLVYADIVFDFIFVIDTILHLLRPYIDEDTGDLITDRKAIVRKHLGSLTFYSNAIACIPILKMPLSPFLSNDMNAILSLNFNVLRMIRIFHFPAQFDELKKIRSRQGPVNESVFRMWIIIFFTFLLIPIFGCLYFGLSTLKVDDMCPHPDEFSEEILTVEMWVSGDFVITDVMNSEVCEATKPEVKCEECPLPMFFMRSIYFLMQTLFTIGYGDSVAPSKSHVELSMACVFMLFGVFGYGLTIANMTSVLANLDVVNMRFRREMDIIARWISFRSIPEKLKEQIRLHFLYLNRTQGGMLDYALFSSLPPKLTQDIASMQLDFLQAVPFFNPIYRSQTFLLDIANVLSRRIYSPGSQILYQNERQRELIVILEGRAEVYVHGNPKCVGCLTPGDFMGDYQLLFGTINQVGLRSLDCTVVLVLSFEALTNVLNHPNQNHFGFLSMGSHFRNSSDQGALDTIKMSREQMEAISRSASHAHESKTAKIHNMMEETDAVAKGYILYPDSKIHVYWDIFALLSTVYYLIVLPVRMASHFGKSSLQTSFNTSYLIDYVADCMFILDMVLRTWFYAYTSYESGRSEVVTDCQRIKQKYMSSKRFKLDLFASFPLDITSVIFGYHLLWRIPKTCRLLQIPRIVSDLQRHLDSSMEVTMTEVHVSSLLMLIYSILISVWSSAGWYSLRSGESAYKSIYWAFTTLTTVGYGDFVPETFAQTCYVFVVGSVGATFCAAIVANVTSFFHDVEISEDSIDHKVKTSKLFMERHNQHQSQVKNLQDYFDLVESNQGGFNDDIFLNQAVPEHLKANLLTYLTQSMVLNCDLFAGCESGFKRKLMLSLEQSFFVAESVITTASKYLDGMYFVKKGMVEIFSDAGGGSLKLERQVEVDEYFAEGCLVHHWGKQPFMARSSIDTELWFLSRSTFYILMDFFPKVQLVLCNIDNKSRQSARRSSMKTIQKSAENFRKMKSNYIHPDNYFIQFWIGLVLVVILYNIIVLPFRVAYMENHEITFTWLFMDYCGDAILAIDVFIRASTLAYYNNNRLVVERGKIWSHYLKSGKLKWHLISFVPIETITLAMPTLCPLWSLQFWSLLRINRTFRSVEMPYFFNW
eukprot:CAMPEP_0194358636 /NCGR_PEP_ID=MMETSP0174-20130528/5767_1 /TAXON_ID=216777 /ORGANISM="Proboscia alata, Strain PI-D3" /LENGTH=1177 /DNA_ID=CAMNT_0039129005 /DNA_START=138 /DNA_END=3668 /DNA_ORIENTATION=-